MIARTLMGLLAAVLLTGCGSTGSSGTPDAQESANPLDTGDNATSCTAARREVSERADVFGGVANGTALPADAATAAQELQKETGDLGSFATGTIKTQLLALSDAYGRMRVTLTTGDVQGLTAAVAEQNTALDALDKDCGSIGK